MTEFFIALKKVIIVIMIAILGYFLAYFILVNDHMVTIYLNPVFHAPGSFVKLQVWQFLLGAFFFGAGVSILFSWLYVSKQERRAEFLIQENQKLKGSLDRFKKDVSKCVT